MLLAAIRIVGLLEIHSTLVIFLAVVREDQQLLLLVGFVQFLLVLVMFLIDGGGSIRIPAAYNGIFGLKATAGRISGIGAFPSAPTVGVVGPLASSAHDLALSYMISAGPSSLEPTTILQPPPTIESFQMTKSLSDVRLGVFWPHFNDAVIINN